MLADRLKTSAVLILLTALLLWLDATQSIAGAEGLFLVPLLLFFALGTAWDLSSLISRSHRPVKRGLILACTAGMVLSPTVPLLWNAVAAYAPNTLGTYPVTCPIGNVGWIVVAGIAVMFGLFLDEMRQYGRVLEANETLIDMDVEDDASPHSNKGAETDSASAKRAVVGGVTDRLMTAAFVCLYVGLPMGLLVALRGLGEGNWGLAALLTMIATTKSADAGAYFAGKSFGRHKLIPRLSPGKTWEGVLGGVVISTATAAACLTWLFPWIVGETAWNSCPGVMLALILGPVLALTGIVGDLAESLVKRDCGAKDSGNLLPGLGGVWDVTDSLIAAVLPAFLCFAAVA